MTPETTRRERPKDAVKIRHGHVFDDFTRGRVFEHEQRRTVLDSDAMLFTTLTLHYNPLYLDGEAARRAGHRAIPVNPLLVFNTVFGLSVEDLSEGGGPFLGVEALTYGDTVYPGDTLRARSTVIASRLSEKHPLHGIVTWQTEGLNQDDATVIAFRRSNLVRRSR